MSVAALIRLSKELDARLMDKFGGRLPIRREIVGYSKGHWQVRYTFKTVGGYSYETRWEQDERSKAHQEKYPND